MKKLILSFLSIILLTNLLNAQSNSKNEFDYVGKLHNEIVNSYLENNFVYSNTTELCSQIHSIASNNKNFLAIAGNSTCKVNPIEIDNGIVDFKNYFKNTIEKQSISDEAKSSLKNLVNYLFEKAFTKSEVSYEEINNFILKYEDNIISNTKLSKTDKQVILSSTSVARYSLFYWNNHYKKSNSDSQTNSTEGRSWWQWLIVGVCDVGGAIAGAAGSPALAITTAATASTTAYNMTNPKSK